MLDAIQSLGPEDHVHQELTIIRPLPPRATALSIDVQTSIQTLKADHREGLCLPELIDHSKWGKVGLLRIAQPSEMQHVITLYTGSRRYTMDRPSRYPT